MKRQFKITTPTEAALSLLAALLVLFSAMFDPRVSVTLAIFLLVLFSAYKFVYARRGQ